MEDATEDVAACMQGPFSDEDVAASASPCEGWLSTTQHIFKGGQACLELFSAPPKKAIRAQPVSALNPEGSASSYSLGSFSEGCTCPDRVMVG